MNVVLQIFSVFLLSAFISAEDVEFPDDFIIGVANAAYQCEGAWNEDGKGLSIWDNFTHRSPSPIKDNSTGDVATDSYHRYKEDIALAAATGSDFYRFSMSWPRILPTGYANETNQKGIDYYKDFVQELIDNGLKPVLTIYHWDLPQNVYEETGGWSNSTIVPIIVDFARVLIQNFPEVYSWITINEPRVICRLGYGNGNFAPGISSSGLLEYECNKNVIKAHAAIYHMYKTEFSNYTAKMGIVVDTQWFEPKTDSDDDVLATERKKQFEIGMYLHPIVKGDWPDVVKERVDNRSALQNLTESRLPAFTDEEIEFIKDTYDFIGVNHYYTNLVADANESDYDTISYDSDVRVAVSLDPDWDLESNGWAYVPLSLRRALNWVKDQYGDNEIFIAEVGYTEDGSSTDDVVRIQFFKDFFCNVLAAINLDNVTVTGLTTWSLMDNFGWKGGYTTKYGLYSVDFNDTALPRTAKSSLAFWQNLTSTRTLNCTY